MCSPEREGSGGLVVPLRESGRRSSCAPEGVGGAGQLQP